MVHHQHWNVHHLKKKSTHTAEEGDNHSFQPRQLSLTRWCMPSFRPSDIYIYIYIFIYIYIYIYVQIYIQKRGTQSKRRNALLPKKAQNVQTVQTNRLLKRTSSLFERKEARPDQLTSFRPFFHLFSLSLQFPSPPPYSFTVTARPR